MALLLMLAAPAAAEPAGLRYQISWGGFHAGDMALTRDEAGDGYRIDMALHTVGLFDSFLRLRFAAEAEGGHLRDGQLRSGHYQTHYRSRREERLLRVGFDPAGRPGEPVDHLLATFLPPDPDEEPNPPVPEELRLGTADPLSNLLQVGLKARAAVAGQGPVRFTLATFDGRRRYDFEVTVKGRLRVHVGDHDYDAVAVHMAMQPRAGFKPHTLRWWEGAEYLGYVDPLSGLPLKVESLAAGPVLVITRVGECRASAAECRAQPLAAR